MHNDSIYPMNDRRAVERVDCPIGLAMGTAGGEYLEKLRAQLPPFLDSVSRSRPIALAIYNAGTDVLVGDPLGGLALSGDDVLTRDLFVLRELGQRKIPVVMLTSGGYTEQSHQLIARTIAAAANDDFPAG
jgi:histone deacetylase 11